MSYLTSKVTRGLCAVAVGVCVAACGNGDESSPHEPVRGDESEERLGQLLDASAPRGEDAPVVDAGAPATPTTPATPDAPAEPSGKSCLTPSRDNFASDGPYGVKSKTVTVGQLGQYTIFYPERFAADCKHPVAAWGNGTGVNGTKPYEHWHRRAASHGVVIIASHNANAGSQRFLEGGIDYLLKENTTAGSEFNGKLSDRAGSAGHSQGGFAATTATRHPSVRAEVNVQGGGTPAEKAAMICLTGTDDFVRTQCTASYNSAKGPAFLADLQGADHIGTPASRGIGTPNGNLYIQLYTAWFRCFLAEDDAACGLFRGGKSAPVCKLGQYATCDGRNIP
ncbi:MAG: hypothetical protein ABW252_05435 [Polyangiales bacterium]